jgi:hypothetical protein
MGILDERRGCYNDMSQEENRLIQCEEVLHHIARRINTIKNELKQYFIAVLQTLVIDYYHGFILWIPNQTFRYDANYMQSLHPWKQLTSKKPIKETGFTQWFSELPSNDVLASSVYQNNVLLEQLYNINATSEKKYLNEKNKIRVRVNEDKVHVEIDETHVILDGSTIEYYGPTPFSLGNQLRIEIDNSANESTIQPTSSNEATHNTFSSSASSSSSLSSSPQKKSKPKSPKEPLRSLHTTVLGLWYDLYEWDNFTYKWLSSLDSNGKIHRCLDRDCSHRKLSFMKACGPVTHCECCNAQTRARMGRLELRPFTTSNSIYKVYICPNCMSLVKDTPERFDITSKGTITQKFKINPNA